MSTCLNDEKFDLLSIISNSSLFGVIVYRPEDNARIVFANKHAADIFGYATEEMLNITIPDLVAEGPQKEEVLKSIDRRARGEIFHKEYSEITLISKSGASLTAMAFVYTIIYEDRPAGLIIFYDITKQKALNKLFSALSRINQLIVRVDDEDKLLEDTCDILVDTVGYFAAVLEEPDSNSELFRLKYIKSKSKELEGEFNKLLIGSNLSKPYGRGTISKAYNTKKVSFIFDVLNNAELHYWSDYYRRFGIDSVCSIPLIKNNTVRYVLCINDKTRDSFSSDYLHLLEEIQIDLSFALENIEKNRQLRVLNEAAASAHEWVLTTDSKGKIVSINDAVMKISGYSREELIGKSPSIFKSGHHDDKFYKSLWKTITDGNIFQARFTNKNKDGSVFYLDKMIIPIAQNGKIYRYVDLSRDITDTIKYHRQLKLQSRLYSTLYEITNLSIVSKTEEEFLNGLPAIFVEHTQMEIAYLGQVENGQLKMISYSIGKQEYTKLLEIVKSFTKNISLGDPKGRSLFISEKSIKYKRVYMINDIDREVERKPDDDPFKQLYFYLKLFNIHSYCCIPVIKNGKAVKFIVIGHSRKNTFDRNIYSLLNSLTRQIEFILNKFEEDKLLKMVQTAIDTGFEFIVITDENFRIIYANNRALDISGYSKGEIIGKRDSVFSSGRHSKEFAVSFYETLKLGKVFSGVMEYKSKSGEVSSFYTTIIPFKQNGRITHYISIGKKIGQEERLKEELKRLVSYDSTTGLLNLNSFKDSINRFTQRAKYENFLGATAIINPISFKSINQALGFERGNKILRIIAERIKHSLRSYDVIAKLESDRFGVLIKDLKNEEDIYVIVMKILSSLTKPYQVNDHTISLAFNIGLSLFPKDGEDAGELLHRARVALTDAKYRGENQIGFFKKDLETTTLERLKLRKELEDALRKREFIAFYQPYVDRHTNVAGAEALIRWKKNGKIIPPMEFIPFLEKTELIVDVEDYMIDIVLKEIAKLKLKGIDPPSIAINISERTFRKEGFSDDILSKLSAYNLDGKQLKIEIIERALLKDFEQVKSLIREIKKQGVLFSIDDFGTGYSSLSYLAELPVNYLKIDISFIRKITQSQHTKKVVQSIIYVANSLGIKTIAEGVETGEQFELLKEMGCDYFQGYYFYRPMGEEEFEGIVKTLFKKKEAK